MIALSLIGRIPNYSDRSLISIHPFFNKVLKSEWLVCPLVPHNKKWALGFGAFSTYCNALVVGTLIICQTLIHSRRTDLIS